jgi:hypothetical protein
MRNRIIKPTWLGPSLAVLLLVFLSAIAYGDETIAGAERSLQQGYSAFEQGRWSNAAHHFKKSYNQVHLAMTAYMVSASFNKLGSVQLASDWARIALSEGLREPYKEGARTIIAWAQSGVEMRGKADSPSVQIPSRSDLGIRKRPVPASRNLTGRWRCDDGGTYFIRQIGNELWWYGQSADGGRRWSNVFKGKIRGNEVNGRWADIPRGRAQNNGQISLRVVGSRKLRAIKKTGGFGGNEWAR